ncbi:MAG: hypothetical protein ABIR32_03945 [Ilumatobacteraceae bacterium]
MSDHDCALGVPPEAEPDTVTEAVALLRVCGYVDDVELQGAVLACARTATTHPFASVIVDHTFRFEGDSDPGDEAIVLGLRFPDIDLRAVLVSAFGHDAAPETARFFRGLRNPD